MSDPVGIDGSGFGMMEELVECVKDVPESFPVFGGNDAVVPLHSLFQSLGTQIGASQVSDPAAG